MQFPGKVAVEHIADAGYDKDEKRNRVLFMNQTNDEEWNGKNSKSGSKVGRQESEAACQLSTPDRTG